MSADAGKAGYFLLESNFNCWHVLIKKYITNKMPNIKIFILKTVWQFANRQNKKKSITPNTVNCSTGDELYSIIEESLSKMT